MLPGLSALGTAGRWPTGFSTSMSSPDHVVDSMVLHSTSFKIHPIKDALAAFERTEGCWAGWRVQETNLFSSDLQWSLAGPKHHVIPLYVRLDSVIW
jgi:hypothetical protein